MNEKNDYILRSDAVFAFCGNCEGTEVCGQLGEPCEEVKRIKAIPAADVEPVRPGRWVSKEGIYGVVYCSICDFELKIDNTLRCPNCGAKMDKEEKRDDD